MKKFIFLGIVTLFTLLFVTSCGIEDKTDFETDNAVLKESTADKVYNTNSKFNTINIVVDSQIKYSGKYVNNGNTTAFELLKRLCEDNGLEYGHLDGYVNAIADYSNTAERGWLYFFNGEMPSVAAADYNIVKGYDNTVEFKYMKYSEAFPE